MTSASIYRVHFLFLPCWLLFFLCVPSSFAMDLCHFSSLCLSTSDEKAESLILSMYSQLLESPAARGLSAEVIQKMVAGGDPYEIPEVLGHDTFALRSQLRKFKEIIEKKRWDSHSVRKKLLANLTQRLTKASQASKTQRDAVRTTADIVLNLHEHARVSNIPVHAKSLILSKSPRELRIFDLNTNSLEQLSLSPEYFSEALVTADGKQMVFGRFKGKLTRVPFDGKKLDWGNARDLGEDVAGLKKISVQGLVSLGGAENLVLADTGSDKHPAFVYSLKNETRSSIDLSPLMVPERRIMGWGPVGDNGRVFFLVRRIDDSMLDLYVTQISASGKLSILEKEVRRIKTKNAQSSVVWPDAAADPIIYTSNWLKTYPQGDGQGKILFETSNDDQIQAVEANGQFAVALVKPWGINATKRWLEIIDLRSDKPLGQVALSGIPTELIKLLSDGRVLAQNLQDGRARIIDLSFHLDLVP